jgi:hypothetical protein
MWGTTPKAIVVICLGDFRSFAGTGKSGWDKLFEKGDGQPSSANFNLRRPMSTRGFIGPPEMGTFSFRRRSMSLVSMRHNFANPRCAS